MADACMQKMDCSTSTGGSGDGGGGWGGKSQTLARRKATVIFNEARPSKCGQWLHRELRDLEKDMRKHKQEEWCGGLEKLITAAPIREENNPHNEKICVNKAAMETRYDSEDIRGEKKREA